VSIHQALHDDGRHATVPIHERVSPIRDACNSLNAHRRGREDEREEVACGYHPHCVGRYDSTEDRSPSPVLLGPQVFGRHILNAPFPSWYRLPTNIPKYSRETNHGLWLEDYWLACQASGMNIDSFIICNLPLFLADSA
jgi:hypothetical protein